MSRGGARTTAEEPKRKCIVSGEVQPKGGLIRFVVGPDGQIVPDVAGKLPGRGIYVSARREALEARAARPPSMGLGPQAQYAVNGSRTAGPICGQRASDRGPRMSRRGPAGALQHAVT